MYNQSFQLAERLVALATQKGLMVATAESCTGGMVAAAITDVAGSSTALDRGFVTYSNEAKQDMLGVSKATLDRVGAVSEAVAKEMAFGAIINSRADVAISITGIAGPGGGSADKPVGLVWFGLCSHGQPPVAEKMLFADRLPEDCFNRSGVRAASVEKAMMMMLGALRDA